MNNTRSVLFDEALVLALEKTKSVKPVIAQDITLIRDLRGRIRLLLPGSESDYQEMPQLKALARELSDVLGVYGFTSERITLFTDDLAQGLDIAGLDRSLISDGQDCKVWLLDRQITGQDWLRQPFTRTTSNRRVTFYGVKGGVGRSTALIVWAWRLAKQGKKVLIFDLDLESPGVSSTLLPTNYLPDFGIVDWFVEDSVGQASIIEKEMIASSPIGKSLPGELKIVPAFGSKTNDYLPKLARCYLEPAYGQGTSWGERLERLVAGMELSHKPDVVILDSRAGIHDIAATAINRMDAQSLLFAVDSPQTWNSYAFLFRHWKQHPQLALVRNRLQVVASMVPETGRDEYIKRLNEHAWDLFRENLYDEVAPGDTKGFSFDIDDEDAPHHPIPVYWHRALQEFDPANVENGLDEKLASEALGEFMDKADQLIAIGDGEVQESE